MTGPSVGGENVGEPTEKKKKNEKRLDTTPSRTWVVTCCTCARCEAHPHSGHSSEMMIESGNEISDLNNSAMRQPQVIFGSSQRQEMQKNLIMNLAWLIFS